MKDGKFSIGVIGLSKRGVRLGCQDFVKAGNCYLTCICDFFPELVENALNIVGDDVTAYTDMDEFLKHPDLDAVIVATNDKTHAEIAIKVLKAKKHLFLEKPMAQTIEDCDNIIDAWQGSNTVFMIGLELRYCALMTEVKKIVENGDIGKIIISTIADNVSVGGDYYFHGRKRKKDYIKSLILEKGTHSLDLANWIIDDSPVKVYASGGLDVFGGNEEDIYCADCQKGDICPYNRTKSEYMLDIGAVEDTHRDKCVYSKECEVSDNSLVLVDYKNGARLSYMECHFTPEYSREFTFIGDKGKLTAFYNNEQDFKIMVWKRHEIKPVYYYPPKRNSIGSHGGGDEGIIREFSAQVSQGVAGMFGIKGARDSAAIAIAAYESEESGLPVEIPPSTC